MNGDVADKDSAFLHLLLLCCSSILCSFTRHSRSPGTVTLSYLLGQLNFEGCPGSSSSLPAVILPMLLGLFPCSSMNSK